MNAHHIPAMKQYGVLMLHLLEHCCPIRFESFLNPPGIGIGQTWQTCWPTKKHVDLKKSLEALISWHQLKDWPSALIASRFNATSATNAISCTQLALAYSPNRCCQAAQHSLQHLDSNTRYLKGIAMALHEA